MRSTFFHSLRRNQDMLAESLNLDQNDDIVTRSFTALGRSCALYFVEGMASGQRMSDSVLRPLLRAQEELSGRQALEAFESHKPGTYAAILMDVMMPNMDGLDATRAIRALDRADAKVIPIIAMTANAFEEDARKCMEAGMNAHLPKPIRIERLVAVIAGFCGARQA